MAQKSGYGSIVNMSTASSNAEKRKRERLLRRQQIEMDKEKLQDMPSFSEPRRITAERQDSLTNLIRDTLPDVSVVRAFIHQDPKIWFGTSRNAFAKNSNSTPQESNYNQRDGTSNTRPNRGDGGDAFQSKRQSASPAKANQQQSSKFHPTEKFHSKPTSRDEKKHSKGDFVKSNRCHEDNSASTELHDQSAPNDAESLKEPLSALVSSNQDYQSSTRERLKSEELLNEIESIFQEFEVEQALSDIHTPNNSGDNQTPQVETEFDFSRNTQNNITSQMESSNNSINAFEGVTKTKAETACSDTDSSDDDDSESEESDEEHDEEEEQDEKNTWDLESFVSKLENTDESLLKVSSENSSTSKAFVKFSPPKTSTQFSLSKNYYSSSQSPQTAIVRLNDNRRSSERKYGDVPEANQSDVSLLPKQANIGVKPSGEKSQSKDDRDITQPSSSPSDSISHRSSSSSSLQNRHKAKKSPPDRNILHEQSVKRIGTKSTAKSGRSSGNKARSSSKDSLKSSKSHRQSSVKPKNSEKIKQSVHSRNNTSLKSPSVPFASYNNSTLTPGVSSAEQQQRVSGKDASSVTSRRKRSLSSRQFSTSSESGSDEDSSSSSSSSSDTTEETAIKNGGSSKKFVGKSRLPVTNARSSSTSSSKERKSPIILQNPTVVMNDIYNHNQNVPTRKQTGIRSKPPVTSRVPPQTSDKEDTAVKSNYVSKLSVAKLQEEQDRLVKERAKFKVRSNLSEPKIKKSKKKSDNRHKDETYEQLGNRDRSDEKLPVIKLKNTKLTLLNVNSPSPNPSKKVEGYPSLWVKLRLGGVKKPATSSRRGSPNLTAEPNNDPDRNPSNIEPPHIAKYSPNHINSPVDQLSAMSTGSETAQPSRRADNVQVAVAASSSDLSPRGIASLQKRKLIQADANNGQSCNSESNNQNSKRRKQEVPSPQNPQNMMTSNKSSKSRREEHAQWKNRRKEQPNQQQKNSTWNSHSSKEISFSRNSTAAPSSNQLKSASNNSYSHTASIVSEPDSSWPEQERLLKADQYMRQGKRLKHEGDAIVDSRTGRTRPGESLSRALVYFEATLCFVMNGYMLEMENANDQGDGTPGPNHSPAGMHHQTIELLDYIRKMRPHGEQEQIAFKRLNLSCLRSQALLYLRIYKLRKEHANKFYDAIGEQFKQTASKSNRTPSPWHTINSHNVVSPVSPAVPSPYGTMVPGPSPVPGMNNCEPVSSSTQVSKMASPASQNNIVLSPKIYDIMKNYHTIIGNLTQAHEKWDQAEGLYSEHADFFQNVDTFCGMSLGIFSSLRDMATYNKVVLHRLREGFVKTSDEYKYSQTEI